MRRTGLTLMAAAAAVAVVATASPASATTSALTVTGLTANDRLVTFTADNPGHVLSQKKITGIGHADVEGIDYRPATGGLYALVTDAEGAKLFLVDPKTGAATRVGTTVYPIAGEISIDFNPTVDRLRVVSTDGTNLRVNPNDGALAATDKPLAYGPTDKAAGADADVAGAAYTNNDNDYIGATPPAGATGTTLYDIDAALDTLVVQAPPNDGVLTTVGALPAKTKAQATGFDIYTNTGDAKNRAFVSLNDKGRTALYEIDLATGAKIAKGHLSGHPAVTDIALAPAQAGF
ncbi:DUF4394 domain-containing protein [Modestobacter sp. I12A-02628]|uniref:DUF4394 domain-containing protein n=1 Tax=Goekera deserti TaxID=2497753 RepID=A0A7K3WIM1_9ACTN|nr:DUF4394 domain-containing protein [Goekera deserti]MPQ96657.1 DUF4394 domain-containing protein [Goekera deserti]NDI47031.1 DUF4394 domain-containing protein [Goekera deserti]NEL56267.1 DUF4394 domain-containing protein [Goekera deserti]